MTPTARRAAVVTIVRHGETDHNRARIIQGHLDTPLNAEGEAQALVAGKYLRTVRFDAIWSSDLSRARKTAQIIRGEQVDPVELQEDERIRERHLGALQGQTRDAASREDALTIEPVPAFRRRLFSFWDHLFPPSPTLSPPSSDLTSTATDEPLQILVVSHGGSIRQHIQDLIVERRADYIIELCGEEKKREGIEKRVGNCCVTEVRMEQILDEGSGGWRWVGRVTKYADEDHFDESSRAPSPARNEDVIDE